jgi:hypothetical protein
MASGRAGRLQEANAESIMSVIEEWLLGADLVLRLKFCKELSRSALSNIKIWVARLLMLLIPTLMVLKMQILKSWVLRLLL